jgi:pyrroline-5-carboxylate reductase
MSHRNSALNRMSFFGRRCQHVMVPRIGRWTFAAVQESFKHRVQLERVCPNTSARSQRPMRGTSSTSFFSSLMRTFSSLRTRLEAAFAGAPRIGRWTFAAVQESFKHRVQLERVCPNTSARSQSTFATDNAGSVARSLFMSHRNSALNRMSFFGRRCTRVFQAPSSA